MPIIPGPHAKVIRPNPNRYQEGVYFLARTVEQILSLAFFYHRLTDQLTSGSLSGIEYEQARYSHIACHSMLVVELHKLVDNNKDAWSFDQLFKEWKRYEHDQEKQSIVLAAIADLKVKLAALTGYRHEKLAHQSKKIQMTQLTALPSKIKHLQEIVEVMDMFVAGPIPYTLYLHDTLEQLDLRDLMDLT
ncbi:MAG: hypothetical protein MN733_33450 [Nitrososphaera sp.]|nr:hypothetical protein [Nitrososphaera sp.]